MEEKNVFKAIIAVNNLGFIGLNNELPWYSPEDFKHFKKMTLNSRLLVGYRTKLTMPKLINREIVLDSREIMDISNIDWCIGGKKTYEKYAHLFEELHISHIDDDTIGDTLFPDLRNLNPNCKVFNYNFPKKEKLFLNTFC